ncbi:MAG: hypothetical protein CR984_00555 [Proteobacteria bacterium]|nr:MAG: hypothetical protein CR984_00555 [Pseudomonadota bacterium]PIE67790.1 MAG: hypothetical protein CSA23_02165 [Deltaproteobacteria bacterium]
MDASIDETRQALFTAIVAALKEGGRLNRTILEYVDANLFSPDPRRLATFLCDESDCERDSLLDLVFYPDIAFQIHIDPLLIIAGGSETQRDLQCRLIDESIRATICLPDGRPLTPIILPEFVKAQYLTRLKVDWQLDTEVAAAIYAGVSADRRPQVRVRLRNSGLVLSGSPRLFLIRFFERLPDDGPDYLACLDLILPLLAGQPHNANIFDLLVDRKRVLFRGLQQLMRFEKQRRRSTMETLMLQGVRMPHISREETLREMELIDQICMGIFGRTETIVMPMEEPARQVSELDSAAAVVQSLMG